MQLVVNRNSVKKINVLSFRVNKINLIVLFFILPFKNFAQQAISEVLKKYNNESIPYITVSELSTKNDSVVLLDARELSEYETSHIKNAIYVGYDNFKLRKTVKQLTDKQQTVVVYCSLGIRSEDIAEKLKKSGFKQVFNLYGGIFEWKNNDFKVYDSNEEETEKVHTFSKEWSKWLKKGIKIYD